MSFKTDSNLNDISQDKWTVIEKGEENMQVSHGPPGNMTQGNNIQHTRNFSNLAHAQRGKQSQATLPSCSRITFRLDQ